MSGSAVRFRDPQWPIPERSEITEFIRTLPIIFRWIKQHLRIKTFYGTSPNAVKTQIWIAVSIYLLVAILKKRLHLPGNLHTILQILEVNIFEKRSIIQIVNDAYKQEPEPSLCNKLNLFNS